MSTLILRPSSDVVNATFTVTPSGAMWSTIDEVTENTSDYVASNSTTAQYFLCGFDGSALAGKVIEKITFHAKVKAQAAGNICTVYFRTRIASVDYDVSAGYNSTTETEKTYELRLNPATKTAWTASDLATLVAGIRQIASVTGYNYVYQFWIEVTYADETNDVLTLRPNSDVLKSAAWIPSTGTDHYALLDEAVTDDADYISATAGGANQWDTYGFENPAVAYIGAIAYVRLVFRIKMNSGANIQFKMAGTLLAGGTSLTNITTATNITMNFVLNPTTGVAWTWADISALEASILAYMNCWCYQAYVEVHSWVPYPDDVKCYGAGVGYAAVKAHLRAAMSGNINFKQAQIDNALDFATPLVDSGELAASEGADAYSSVVLTWTPPAAGIYYARFGARKTAESSIIWGTVTQFVVSFPTLQSVTVSHVGERYRVTVTLADDYVEPPDVTVSVDGQAKVANLT